MASSSFERYVCIFYRGQLSHMVLQPHRLLFAFEALWLLVLSRVDYTLYNLGLL